MNNVLNSYTVPAATPTELSQLLTARFQNGQPAFVQSNGQSYNLVSSISTIPDGKYVIAALDDPTKQWVSATLLSSGACAFLSEEIDFTAIGTTFVAPAIVGKRCLGNQYTVVTTQAAGVASTAATFSIGNTIFPANMTASTAGILTAALFILGVGWYTRQNIVNPQGNAPVSGEATNLSISIPATGTGGFIWKGKFCLWAFYV